MMNLGSSYLNVALITVHHLYNVDEPRNQAVSNKVADDSRREFGISPVQSAASVLQLHS